MLIKYQPKHDHIKCVPLIPVTDEQKKFNLTRSQVSLLPGINEVTDNEWDVMKTHLSREIARKEISVYEKKKGAHNLKDIPSLQEAVSLVNECVNPDTLKKWYQEETRQEVRLAIVEKMKELKVDVPKFTGNVTDDENENDGNGNEKDLDKMTVDELKAYAAEKGIEVSGNKADILAAIKEAEEK